jgi:hypothetical protein
MMHPADMDIRVFTIGPLVNKNNSLDPALVAHQQLAIGHANDRSADFDLFAVGIGGCGWIRVGRQILILLLSKANAG